MKILIFIVAYNAEKTIESVLRRIPESMTQYDTEVLIIDDASKDNTWDRARRFKESEKFPFKLTLLVNPVNQGYGGNQKLGFLYAMKNGFDLVAMVHGDGQYAPEALPMLVKPIVEGDADAVFGSRMMTAFGALKGGMPLYKYVGNRILTAFQNIVLQSSLSEFHTGYRLYSTKALARVPFQFNTNDFHFDTEIIIQMLLAKLKIKELSIPTFYGDEVCHVNGMKYALDVAIVTTIARLQSFSLMYRRNFDINGAFSEKPVYEPKLTYDSSHTRALTLIPKGSKVLDMGCSGVHLCDALRAKGCNVTGIGSNLASAHKYNQFINHELGNSDLPVTLDAYDYVLLLDEIEQQRSPERFMTVLNKACTSTRKVQLIVTAGNVAFFITRLMLLWGQFNYGKRGILDLTHTRLFTFPSLTTLLESNGFQVVRSEGIPAPFPLAIKSENLSSKLLNLNSFLIKLRKRLFSFQMLIVARPWPSIDYVLKETTEFTDGRTRNLDLKKQTDLPVLAGKHAHN
ncbi:MAG TPA: bifunctional glycosyltransferase/class I SAM-dependent methyltransferase [Planktothrix sp.]